MAPHTCKCKICGFEWIRNDLPDETVNHLKAEQETCLKTNELQPSQRSSNLRQYIRQDASAKKDISSRESGLVINKLLEKVPVVSSRVTARAHTTGGKNSFENAETCASQQRVTSYSARNVKSDIDKHAKQTIEKTTGTIESDKSTVENETGNKSGSKATSRHSRRISSRKLGIKESSRSAIKDFPAVPDEALVIPDVDITAEREAIIKFDLDDMEMPNKVYTGTLGKCDQYLNIESLNRQCALEKEQEDKENIDIKEELERNGNSLQVRGRVKDYERNSVNRSLSHNMPGIKVLDF